MSEARVFQRNSQILIKINSSNANNTHIIYQPISVPSILNPIDPIFNGFIQDLRIKIDINSLDAIPLPVIEPELTEAERLVLWTELEWRNARMELSILKSSDGSNWIEIARLAMQNREPYYSIDLLPYFTKQADAIVGNEWIACKVINSGHGLLSGNDELVIYGSCQLQAHYYGETDTALPSPAATAVNFGVEVNNTSTLVAIANPNRRALHIINLDSGSVYIALGTQAENFSGLALIGRGASYLTDYSSLWTGSIYAITPEQTIQRLSCVELV